MRSYDLLVIGSGPGGAKAALQAAKLNKRVAIIEGSPYLGGAGIHTGTLPSKTLRETALYLSGFKQRAIYGFQYTLGPEVTLQELMYKKTEVIRGHMEVLHDQFSRNNVELIHGFASFLSPTNLLIRSEGGATEELSARKVIIATGSRPAHSDILPSSSDSEGRVYDSDTILTLGKIPRDLTVIGGGVIGCEYACIFACLGVKVTLVDSNPRLLSFGDEEIVTSLIYWMRHNGITIRSNEDVDSIRIEKRGKVETRLKSGKVIVTEILLYARGRLGNTDRLALENIGIKAGKRGLLKVNDHFETEAQGVYAVGDVIGFPSLASTSREQGRRAACHALGLRGKSCELKGLIPYGIYTIPEISMVGETEESLTDGGVVYESGSAYFHEVARGQITGDIHGMLKILFSRDDLRVLGVHIMGEKASELIHIGQLAINFGATMEYFKDAVFNYPTLSDAYKQAALNGLNKL